MRVGEAGALQPRDRLAGEPGEGRCLFLAQPTSEAETAEPLADVHLGSAAGVRDGAQRRAAAARPSRGTLAHAAWPLPWAPPLRHRWR